MAPSEHDPQRRSEDRDRALNHRLDQLERAYGTLTATVSQLESSVNVVKLEQSHLKEIFDSRMRVIERGQELQLQRLEQIGKDIQTMGNEVEKTPVGRSLLGAVRQVQTSYDEQAETLIRHSAIHESLKEWQSRVDGVLVLLKWLGAGGLVAFILAVLRLLRLLPQG